MTGCTMMESIYLILGKQLCRSASPDSNFNGQVTITVDNGLSTSIVIYPNLQLSTHGPMGDLALSAFGRRSNGTASGLTTAKTTGDSLTWRSSVLSMPRNPDLSVLPSSALQDTKPERRGLAYQLPITADQLIDHLALFNDIP